MAAECRALIRARRSSTRAGRTVAFPAGEALANMGTRAGGREARVDAATDGLQRAAVAANIVIAVLDLGRPVVAGVADGAAAV